MSDAEILSGTADRTFNSFTAYVTISAISELRLLPAESFRGAFFFFNPGRDDDGASR